MEAITQEQWEAEQDARVIGLIANGHAMTPPEIERIEQIEARIRRAVNPRNNRQLLSLIEGFWERQMMQLEAAIGPQPRTV